MRRHDTDHGKFKGMQGVCVLSVNLNYCIVLSRAGIKWSDLYFLSLCRKWTIVGMGKWEHMSYISIELF